MKSSPDQRRKDYSEQSIESLSKTLHVHGDLSLPGTKADREHCRLRQQPVQKPSSLKAHESLGHVSDWESGTARGKACQQARALELFSQTRERHFIILRSGIMGSDSEQRSETPFSFPSATTNTALCV